MRYVTLAMRLVFGAHSICQKAIAAIVFFCGPIHSPVCGGQKPQERGRKPPYSVLRTATL